MTAPPNDIVVGIADCRVSDKPGQTLATYALGSCIGLTLYDPAAVVGGLLHFMLPDSTIATPSMPQNPYMFADTGIPLLLQQVRANGAAIERLLVCAAGGAWMGNGENVLQIGKRNYLAVRRILWKNGLLLHAEAMGGTSWRTIRLEIGSGKLLLREGAQHELIKEPFQKEGKPWRTGY